jgi:hypothetical protein
MIDLQLRVVFDGQKIELGDVKPSDLVALERHFAVAIPRLTGFTFEQSCFLVWRHVRRGGVIDDTVAFDDEFLDRIEGMEQTDVPFDEEESTGGPSPGSSP